MGVERGVKGSPWILKLLAKKVVFSISGGKKQILPLLAPPWKFLGKSPTGTHGKIPSNAHA